MSQTLDHQIAERSKQVEINGQLQRVSAGTLAALLVELDYGERLVATALNQNFVRKTDRAAAILQDGDRIEILVPMQGG